MSSYLRYHEAFGISADALQELEVFNGFVDKDANFYIVPHMLQNTDIAIFEQSYEKYKKHFSDIVRLIKSSKTEGDIFYRRAVKKFIFHEIAHVGLGYSKTGKKGSGIGEKLALQLTKSASEIVQAGIEDPEIFELIGLLEEGIGADRISDMLLAILTKDFLAYTNDISTKLKIPTKKYQYSDNTYQIPYFKNSPIIFVPEKFLVSLPMVIDRDDISMACAHNEALRDRINKIIAESMGEGVKLSKPQLKELLLREPELAKELVELIKKKIITGYDFKADPIGEFIWKELAEEASKKFPINLSKELSANQTVSTICNQYKTLIEDNGLFKFFHNSDGSHKNEKFAQMLFFAIAKSYCEANNLDISPESDAGRGPVDFKMSQGSDIKINVEIKLSTNRLLHGYKKQLPTYNKAENVKNSFYLIILLNEKHTKRIEEVYDYKNKNETADKKLPEIIVVDATWKKSASKV